MLWLNENREKIKQDNPGISFTDIAKKGGELWKKLEDKSVRYYKFFREVILKFFLIEIPSFDISSIVSSTSRL